MAYMLTVDVVPEGGGPVEVSHTFFGATEADARKLFAKHANGCEFLTAAIASDRIEEELDKIDDDERPNYDEDVEEAGDEDVEGEGDEDDEG
jgi:hypothetical protein